MFVLNDRILLKVCLLFLYQEDTEFHSGFALGITCALLIFNFFFLNLYHDNRLLENQPGEWPVSCRRDRNGVRDLYKAWRVATELQALSWRD